MITLNSVQLAAAAPGVAEAGVFVAKFNQVILFPLIMLMTGVAMLYFVYGCVIYIANAENSEARATGRSHIIFSIVGLFVMLSAYGLLMIAANTFGINGVLDCANDPLNKPGCDNVMRVPGNGGYSGGNIQPGGNSGGSIQNSGLKGGAQQ